jgi:hypothetical protein
MAETLELRWDPEPGDWADALRAVVPLYRFAPWFGAAFGFAAVVLLILGQPYPAAFGWLCALVIAGFPIVAVRISFHRNPVASSGMTAKADEDSVRMMTVDGTAYSDLGWTRLTGWLETRRGFVLREGSAFYPVPFRAFSEPQQRQQFRDLAARRLGEPNNK